MKYEYLSIQQNHCCVLAYGTQYTGNYLSRYAIPPQNNYSSYYLTYIIGLQMSTGNITIVIDTRQLLGKDWEAEK